jgi:hypothetical protein
MRIKGLTSTNFVFSRNYIFYAQVAKDLVQNLMRGFNKYIDPPHLGESRYLLIWIKFSNNIINLLAKYHRQDGDPNKSFDNLFIRGFNYAQLQETGMKKILMELLDIMKLRSKIS